MVAQRNEEVNGQQGEDVVNTEQPTGNTVGAAELGFASPFSQLEAQYGVLPSGEHPVRSDDVPRSTYKRRKDKWADSSGLIAHDGLQDD